MATAITMPRLGLSMVEGTVIEWRVRPGDTVAKGDVILTIESEKSEVEVETFAAGLIAAIYTEVGTTVPVGALLGAIVEAGEEFDREEFARRFVAENAAPSPAMPASSVARSGGAAGTTRGNRRQEAAGGATDRDASRETAVVKVAPAARALARRLAVDLQALVGSGPGGRITVADVERAVGPAVVVNGARIASTTFGQGPPLLLIGGYGMDASGWRLQSDVLQSVCTVVTYDQRGIGSSGPLGEEGPTIGQLAEDAYGILAQLGLLPGLIVGASLGAAVALELALSRPDAVRALALIAPPLGRDARLEAALRAWCEYDDPRAEARIRSMLPWFFSRDFLAHDGKREAAAATLRAMAARTPIATLRRHGEALLGWLGTREADLGRIATQSLVVVGSEDLLTTPEQAEAVARGIPNARLEVLAGAGHAVMIERAGVLNSLLVAFAESVTVASPPEVGGGRKTIAT